MEFFFPFSILIFIGLIIFSLFAALSAVIVQLTGFFRPLNTVHGRLMLIKPPKGGNMVKLLAGAFFNALNKKITKVDELTPVWGQTFVFMPTTATKSESGEAAFNSGEISPPSVFFDRKESLPGSMIRVYIPNSLMNLLDDSEAPISREGYFIIQNGHVLASVIDSKIFVDRGAAIKVNLFASSKGIFSLAVVGTAFALLLAARLTGCGCPWLTLLLSKGFKSLLTDWLLFLFPALAFWISLGWIKADLSLRRLAAALAALNPSPFNGESPGDSKKAALPCVPAAWAALWILLVAGLLGLNR